MNYGNLERDLIKAAQAAMLPKTIAEQIVELNPIRWDGYGFSSHKFVEEARLQNSAFRDAMALQGAMTWRFENPISQLTKTLQEFSHTKYLTGLEETLRLAAPFDYLKKVRGQFREFYDLFEQSKTLLTSYEQTAGFIPLAATLEEDSEEAFSQVKEVLRTVQEGHVELMDAFQGLKDRAGEMSPGSVKTVLLAVVAQILAAIVIQFAQLPPEGGAVTSPKQSAKETVQIIEQLILVSCGEDEADPDMRIVRFSEVPVRAGASRQSQIIASLEIGYVVFLLEKHGRRCLIEIPTHDEGQAVQGWVLAKCLRRVGARN